MNKRDLEFFKLLSEDRADSANTLEKPSMRGVQRSVVEKYSDQAHFIYELIQNADDAGATYAKFKLLPDKLIFIHNGTRLFTVTDPRTEDYDTEQGDLGDINAITSIANSNKTGASIGKFGVGFKAVFQYTETPYIYDPNISFKIERFIVPIMLDEKYEEKKTAETAFIFPFNHKKISAEEAYDDISGKLQNLVFPILFLNNLKKISYEIQGTSGEYEKETIEEYDFGNISCEFLSLKSGKDKENLYLFNRESEEGYKYSVGFFVDNNGKLIPKDYYAFCFFPTKANTNLKFIINAPFLLTDSREGIKAKEKHNTNMIKLLAALAAESFVCLRDIGISIGKNIIDDDLLWMVPFNEEKYYVYDEGADISFYPFYEDIYEMMSTEDIYFSGGKYISMSNAYIANSPAITNVFNNSQLAFLYNDDDAGWIFESYGYETIYRARDGRGEYLSSLLRTAVVQDERIISKISAEYILQQEYKWILRLYEFVSDTSRRIEAAKTVPIFISSNGDAVAAFDKDNQEILFIPSPGISGFCVIDEEYIKEKIVKKIAGQMGLSKPSIKDEIYNKIVYKYKNDDDEIDEISDFKKLYAYYKECPQSEIGEYINLIKDCEFLLYTQGKETYRTTARELYYPTDELEEYFSTKKYVHFLDLEIYRAEYEPSEYDLLKDFFIKLGMKIKPEIIEVQISYSEAYKMEIKWPYSSAGHPVSWVEKRLEGAWELVKYISESKDKSKSLLLWNQLIEMIASSTIGWRFPLNAEYRYYYYSPGTYKFEGPCEKLLKNLEWVVNKNGDFCKPIDLTIEDLSVEYDVISDEALKLINYLEIKKMEEEEIPDNLTDSQMDAIRIGQMVQNSGISLEEIQAFINAKQKENETNDFIEELLNIDESETDTEKVKQNPKPRTHTDKIAGQVAKKANGEKKSVDEYVKNIIDTTLQQDFEDVVDEDDYTLSTVNYQKKIERAKDKSSAEIAKIAMLEEAQTRAVESKLYSYGWFQALLDLELLNSSENSSHSREIHISFAKVEKEEGTERTLVLKYPSQNIPQMMEELSDILLTLHMENAVKQIPIEVASVKGYTLRVKAKSQSSLRNLRLDEVTEATIDAQSPIFLLDALKQEFNKLEFEPDFNMKKGLPTNIEFVFGPPGTGKTTCLANEYLIPLCSKGKKILVLTPTNKAADIITQRIIDSYRDDDVSEWLIRFGATSDEQLEKYGVHKDREFNITKLNQYVVVTTMARLPYDYFMTGYGINVMLNSLEWDYIFFDEASMLPLYQVIYPLYKFKPDRFVFAGDPIQIEPITSVDMWKGQNIYTLVGLNSFENPETSPYAYTVRLLTTQYRSIPTVGRIYSELTYGGLLKSVREEWSQKELNISDIIKLNTLNIIKFPVSKYESIYKPKRLNNSSPYHIYSALFTFEFVRFLSEILNVRNYGKEYSIGVVAPYKGQAELIEKLVNSVYLPKNIKVQVGTIHGFQGDESDIVIAVYNPPPSISDSKEMFLNRQNIINVSVSRARDYLIVIMPDENTERVEMMRLVNKVEKLCKASGKCNVFYSDMVENIMFSKNNYIEENTFLTGHQIVNVYGKAEKKYEIRSETTAVDIQLHDVGKNKFNYKIAIEEEKDETQNLQENGVMEQRENAEPMYDEEEDFLEDDFEFEDEDDIIVRMIGEEVIHSKLGVGTIISCDGAYVEIDFSGVVKKFVYPNAFGTYLEAVSLDIQGEILKKAKETIKV